MEKHDCDWKRLFYDGTLYDGYRYFGCHKGPGGGAFFRVWAPRARSVSVVGDFNNWETAADVLTNDGGIWSGEIPGLKRFDNYKFYITCADGRGLYKSDPYAFHGETQTGTASKVYDVTQEDFGWTDGAWIAAREKTDLCHAPVSVYEAHIGSWRKYADGNYFDYRKFADEIVPYLSETGFTHLELMGVAEYPFDGSWGYQVTGYYAPTSRYGTPADFAYLVNKLHESGLGIILDWVPGHFPKDANGLYEFDGAPLYEPEDELKKEHKEWGTRCFDYGRTEVRSFLIGNAVFWSDVYHVDGLRVDAVASMLYLDYGRTEWRPNKFGKNENLEAVDFFRQLNTAVLTRHKGVMMIAEESTAWPLVTRPPEDGGLGFNFKWNMGWMNDTLDYAKTDPLFRAGKHNNLTFSMTYAFSENYILPISHDEVVHGKGSLLNKMPGEYDLKFAGWRNYLMNMFGHPGKKLLFMGGEFAQFAEWNFSTELDWTLLSYPAHSGAKAFFTALNKFYAAHPAMWQIDDDWAGYEWNVADDARQNVIVYERRDKRGERVLCAFNFSPVAYDGYRFGCDAGTFTEALVSDAEGWSTRGKTVKTEQIPSHNKKTSLCMNIRPMSGVYMVCKAAVKAGQKKPETDKPAKKAGNTRKAGGASKTVPAAKKPLRPGGRG